MNLRKIAHLFTVIIVGTTIMPIVLISLALLLWSAVDLVAFPTADRESIALTGLGTHYSGTFTGRVVNGRPVGHGVFQGITPDGREVTIRNATWENGYAQNRAEITYSIGENYQIFQGEIRDTLFHGEGTIRYERRINNMVTTLGSYEGSFREGKRHGHGVRTFNTITVNRSTNTVSMANSHSGGIWNRSNWSYEGEFVDDNPTREGRFYFNRDRTIYFQGEYYNDLPTGHGIIRFTNNRDLISVEGWFEAGILSEHDAVVHYANGDVYVGTININTFNPVGHGTMYFDDGLIFEGRMANGEFEEGTLFWTNGDFYTGSFPGRGTARINGRTMPATATLTGQGWHFQQY